jgi:hypothetical protein
VVVVVQVAPAVHLVQPTKVVLVELVSAAQASAVVVAVVVLQPLELTQFQVLAAMVEMVLLPQ